MPRATDKLYYVSVVKDAYVLATDAKQALQCAHEIEQFETAETEVEPYYGQIHWPDDGLLYNMNGIDVRFDEALANHNQQLANQHAGQLDLLSATPAKPAKSKEPTWATNLRQRLTAKRNSTRRSTP